MKTFLITFLVFDFFFSFENIAGYFLCGFNSISTANTLARRIAAKEATSVASLAGYLFRFSLELQQCEYPNLEVEKGLRTLSANLLAREHERHWLSTYDEQK